MCNRQRDSSWSDIIIERWSNQYPLLLFLPVLIINLTLMKRMKGTVTLICHLSNAIVKWPNCPLLPCWGQLFGSVPRMTKESDVEAEGFCILMIYLALLLFSRSVHRYNVSRTKGLLTLTIWPSDPCCPPSPSLLTDAESDSLTGQCKLCLFKINQNKPFFSFSIIFHGKLCCILFTSKVRAQIWKWHHIQLQCVPGRSQTTSRVYQSCYKSLH